MKTYKTRGMCTNCGYRNYPQWGKYDFGKKLNEYPCPNCECMTWIKDDILGEPETNIK